MKKTLIGAAAFALMATVAQADYALTILHTNDFHARFEPISRFNSGCRSGDNEAGKCFGGSARLMSAIEAARGRAVNSILVDGGDQFQGTLFYNYYKGAAAAEMMNKMGYDAMTVGNHEFDDGPEVLRGFMDSVDFPVLMSNADVSAEPLLSNILKKSTVLEIGGERIGLIGLTPENTDELASPGDHVTFSDPVAAVQGEVDRLSADGVNKIVVLSHSGYATDIRVAEDTTGVDVIVGGHSNTYLSNLSDGADGPYPTIVGDTAIVQAYAYGKFLGELNVVFDDEGVVASATGEPLIMDRFVREDAETKERIAELAAPLEEIRTRIVGQAATSIDGDRANCRYRECEMGNLVADAMLDRVRAQGIHVALANGGGIRASIEEGDVTLGQVFTVLPFQNTLATFQIKGSVLLDALENAVAQFDDPDKDGRFLQVSGMRYAIDPAAEYGARISDVVIEIGGAMQAIDPDATYGVVTNDFVRNGGDGYRMFRTDAINPYDFGPDLADVTVEYLQKTGPYSAYLDGRISFK